MAVRLPLLFMPRSQVTLAVWSNLWLGELRQSARPSPCNCVVRGHIMYISFITLGDIMSATATAISTVSTNEDVVFTDAAAHKVAALISEEGNNSLMLRVFISGGGCSGFQYGFTFDEEVKEGDVKLEKEGVSLLIDPTSIQYLTGAEIDYSEGLEGSQFVIRNPNAATTCGCGSSFSV